MTWVDVLMSLLLACVNLRRVLGKLWSLTRADFAELTGVFKTAHKKP